VLTDEPRVQLRGLRVDTPTLDDGYITVSEGVGGNILPGCRGVDCLSVQEAKRIALRTCHGGVGKFTLDKIGESQGLSTEYTGNTL
jgi:hypothetical protein